eukprot:746001-Hanusia_phi.AAC.6
MTQMLSPVMIRLCQMPALILLSDLSKKMPYFKTFGFITLAILDLSSAIAIHIAEPTLDFICEYIVPPNVTSTLQTQGNASNTAPSRADCFLVGAMQPRSNIVGLLAFLIIWHFAILCSNVLQPAPFGARIVGLRYFLSRSLYNIEELLQHNLHAWILIFSVVVLVLHCRECDFIYNPDELDRNHLIIVKVHSHLHMTRAILTLIQCFGMKTYLRQQLQKAVSTNKRRYMNHEIKVDLDLTYICDRLIAMALPCVDNAVHRNDIRDVAKLLATKHYGTFLVRKIPFHDHNAPLLTQLIRFCEIASHWLNASPKNIVIVHLSAREGERFSERVIAAGDCMDEFARRRTLSRTSKQATQGVAAPSQIRAIHYLEAYLYFNLDIYSDHWYDTKKYALLLPDAIPRKVPLCEAIRPLLRRRVRRRDPVRPWQAVRAGALQAFHEQVSIAA